MRKLKYILLLLINAFLILNIIVIFLFNNGITKEFVKYPLNAYFGSDATVLLSSTSTFMLPISGFQPFVWYLRNLLLVLVLIFSGFLVYNEKNYKNILYFCISTFAFFTVFCINLGTVSIGIHTFFRKINTAYTLAIIDYRWISYYLVIMIPIIIMSIMLFIELRKSKKISLS